MSRRVELGRCAANLFGRRWVTLPKLTRTIGIPKCLIDGFGNEMVLLVFLNVVDHCALQHATDNSADGPANQHDDRCTPEDGGKGVAHRQPDQCGDGETD